MWRDRSRFISGPEDFRASSQVAPPAPGARNTLALQLPSRPAANPALAARTHNPPKPCWIGRPAEHGACMYVSCWQNTGFGDHHATLVIQPGRGRGRGPGRHGADWPAGPGFLHSARNTKRKSSFGIMDRHRSRSRSLVPRAGSRPAWGHRTSARDPQGSLSVQRRVAQRGATPPREAG